MLHKIQRFIILKLVRGWQVRLLHFIFVAVLALSLITNFFQDLKYFYNFQEFFTFLYLNWNRDYTAVSVIAIFCLAQFNISLFLRNWKWDLISVLFALIFLNLITRAEGLTPIENLAISGNTIILFNILFTYTVRLIHADKEKAFVKQVFGRYVNSELLEDLISDPKKMELSGKVQNMTVLFADIRGFTSLSERLEPTKLIQLLNIYLDEMSQIILKYNGTIDKFMGDGIMAFWNAPLPDRDHAQNAISAAIEMNQRLAKLSLIHPEFENLKIGIGINTGDMVIGNIGSKQRLDYTVLGDNVNLAARLESLTKRYGAQLIVTEATLNRCNRNDLTFRQLDEIIVKGKTTPVKIYQPLPQSANAIKLKNAYETAFAAYQRGQFNHAMPIFQKLSEFDKPSALLLDRISKTNPSYLKMWSGVWEWEQK